MLSEITYVKNLNILKSSFNSQFFPDEWNLANVFLSGQKLYGHLQLSVKTFKRNTNCALIRNQLVKIFQKARTSNSLKLYLSYYMLEWPLEQQIAVQLMQTLSSFSTSLVFAQTSNEASLDTECVWSSDKLPQYAEKAEENFRKHDHNSKKVSLFYIHNFISWSQFALKWKDVSLTLVKYFSPREIFSFLRKKQTKSEGESLFCHMDYNYFPLKIYLMSGGKITTWSFVFRWEHFSQ